MPPSLTNDASHYINYTYILLVNEVAKKKIYRDLISIFFKVENSNQALPNLFF